MNADDTTVDRINTLLREMNSSVGNEDGASRIVNHLLELVLPSLENAIRRLLAREYDVGKERKWSDTLLDNTIEKLRRRLLGKCRKRKGGEQPRAITNADDLFRLLHATVRRQLQTIIHNERANRKRLVHLVNSQPREKWLLQDVDFQEGLTHIERSVALLRAIDQLPPHYAAVIRIRFLLGHDLSETASLLKKTPDAIKNLQRNALKNLRTILSEEPDECEPE